jgi:hypothetical protein
MRFDLVARIRLPKQPAKMTIDDKDFTSYTWDEKSKTLFFASPAIQDVQAVKIVW